MRDYLREGDLVPADVQEVQGDGSLALHARSMRSGRLSNGIAVRVSPALVPRQVHHVVHLSAAQAEVILGRNGVCWVGPYLSDADAVAGGPSERFAADAAASSTPSTMSASSSSPSSSAAALTAAKLSLETKRDVIASLTLDAAWRRKLAMTANAIRVLAAGARPITARALEQTLRVCVKSGIPPSHMLDPAVTARIVSLVDA